MSDALSSIVVRRRRGLSLVEVMISLAIAASLLVAVSAAFSASAAAMEINDRFFRASQAGRIAMGQMLAAARKCQDCQVGSSYNGFSTTVSADELNFRATDGNYYRYRYDPNSKTLTLTDEQTGQTYTLAHNVERIGLSRAFTADMAPDPATQVMRPVRVTVSFAVQIVNDKVALSGSAVPRRSAVY